MNSDHISPPPVYALGVRLPNLTALHTLLMLMFWFQGCATYGNWLDSLVGRGGAACCTAQACPDYFRDPSGTPQASKRFQEMDGTGRRSWNSDSCRSLAPGMFWAGRVATLMAVSGARVYAREAA